MLEELVKKTRSIRRFKKEQVRNETLIHLIDMARLGASAANLQPLKYFISSDKKTNDKIFPLLKWAGYLREWEGPSEEERPAAYIIVTGDTAISKSFGCDHGIATQNILLAAAENGLGSCIIGAVNRKALSDILNISEKYRILHVIALGRPAEEVLIEDIKEDGSIEYWRDENGVHHVPKRSIDEIIINKP